MSTYAILKNAVIDIPVTVARVMGSSAHSWLEGATGHIYLHLSAAGTAYVVAFPADVFPRPGAPVSAGQPLAGFRLKSIIMQVQVSGADASAHGIAIYRQKFVANQSVAAPTAVGGTLSYVVDGSSASALPTTARSNPYLVEVSLGTPVTFDATNERFIIRWNITTGATSGSAVLIGFQLKGDLGFAR